MVWRQVGPNAEESEAFRQVMELKMYYLEMSERLMEQMEEDMTNTWRYMGDLQRTKRRTSLRLTAIGTNSTNKGSDKDRGETDNKTGERTQGRAPALAH